MAAESASRALAGYRPGAGVDEWYALKSTVDRSKRADHFRYGDLSPLIQTGECLGGNALVDDPCEIARPKLVHIAYQEEASKATNREQVAIAIRPSTLVMDWSRLRVEQG
jgi:hypothetical protein